MLDTFSRFWRSVLWNSVITPSLAVIRDVVLVLEAARRFDVARDQVHRRSDGIKTRVEGLNGRSHVPPRFAYQVAAYGGL